MRRLINAVFRANYCPTWHNQVWYVLFFSNISLPLLLNLIYLAGVLRV